MIENAPLLACVRTCLVFVTLLALSAAPASAGETGRPAKTGSVSVENASTKKTPEKAVDKPVKLYGTRWHRGAEATVTAAGKARKPAFLVRMLGELDGKT